MSSVSELDLNLEKLFLPAWAQEKPPANRYEEFAEEPPERGDRKRKGRRGSPRREPFGERRGDRPPRAGGKFGDRKREFGRRDDRRSALRDERPEPPLPLPEVNVAFLPDENGVDSLARQIKMTGRAYPLFDIARLILLKPERFSVQFTVKKKTERVADVPSPDAPAEEKAEADKPSAGGTGTVVQPLFACALDDTVWLSEDEAVAHVLRKHFATFYQAERTAIEPPKGTYTFVAQCGMSGVILGPPNHHDYQNQLRKLHAERFSRMPFDVFKSRVKIVKDEAVVKKWVEEQSFKTEYIVLNVPETLKLPNLEEVEKHFRAVHQETIIKSVESHTLDAAGRSRPHSRGLRELGRQKWEQQKRFPLQLASALSQQFAARGLQFFKVNKTFTHVSVARPQFLDLETTPVSEGVKRIIAHINAHPKCTRRQLLEALAPPATGLASRPASDGTEQTGATKEPSHPVRDGTPNVAATTAEPPKGGTTNVEPTPEQTAVIADLHWLVHQGHVIEFADGRLETAKKPAPKPPKPEKKPGAEDQAVVAEPAAEGQAPAEVTGSDQTPVEAAEPAGEVAVSTEAASLATEPAPAVAPAAENPPPTETAAPVPEPSAEGTAPLA
jgi:hypothetical protein